MECRYDGKVLAISSQKYQKNNYLIYATQTSVLIDKDCSGNPQAIAFKVAKSPTRGAPRSISMSDNTGIIALAHGKYVSLFFPRLDETGDDRMIWEWGLSVVCKSQVSSLSFHPSEYEFVVASEYLESWFIIDSPLQVERKWEVKTINTMIRVSFSWDGKFLASLSEYDKLVKIWFKNIDKNSRLYRNIYLSHPRSVTNISWRQPRESKRDTELNILLTMCRDRTARLWREIKDIGPKRFELCVTIDPGQFSFSSNISSEFSPIHWLSQDELIESVAYKEEKLDIPEGTQPSFSEFKLNTKRSSLSKKKRLLEVIKDTPDLLFNVHSDGSILLWGVKNLCETPRAIPQVYVVMKMSQCIPSQDVTFFHRNVFVFRRRRTRYASIFPPELFVVSRSGEGSVNIYSFNLEEFFSCTRPLLSISLYRTIRGHDSDITSIVPHPCFSYSATIDESKNIFVWKSGNPKYNIKARSACLMIGSCYDIEITLFLDLVWFPDVACFVVLERASMSFYFVNEFVEKITKIDILTPLEPCFSHILKHSSNYLLFTIDCSGNVKSWTIELGEKTVSIKNYTASKMCSTNIDLYHTEFLRDLYMRDLYEKKAIEIHQNTQDICTLSANRLELKLWSISVKDDKLIFSHLSSYFDEAKRPMKIAKPGYFWTIGIIYDTEDSNFVDIVKHRPDGTMRSEKKLFVDSNVQDISWCWLWSGWPVLAIRTIKTISLWCTNRTEKATANEKWIKFFSFDLNENIYLTSSHIQWVGNGGLMLSVNEVLLHYHQCFFLSEYNEYDFLPSLDSATNSFSGSLPGYHPKLLLSYLAWGKLDVVKHILGQFYCCLNGTFTTGNSLPILPSHCLSHLLIDDEANEDQADNEQIYSELLDISKFDEEDEGDKIFVLNRDKTSLLEKKISDFKVPNFSLKDSIYFQAVVETVVKSYDFANSLDDNGKRFFYSMRTFIAVKNKQGEHFQVEGLTSKDFSWAYHSEAQENLINQCDEVTGNKLMLNEFKELGIPIWLKNIDTLRRYTEALARNQFMHNDEKDPVKCSLYYLALKRKKILAGLWKLTPYHIEKDKTIKFLENDFEMQKWKVAAKENAFRLISKHRYEYAAAFFLLADCLEDAVALCFRHLGDFQLALLICRVYEGDEGPVLKNLLKSTLIPMAIEGNDRWLMSLFFSMLNMKEEAVKCLVFSVKSIENFPPKFDIQSIQVDSSFDPELLILYKFLLSSQNTKPCPKNVSEITIEIETSFMLEAANTYDETGQTSLSLFLLCKWKPIVSNLQETKTFQETKNIIDTGTFNFDDWGFGSTAPQQKISLFDDEQTIITKSNAAPEVSTFENNVLNDYRFKYCNKLLQSIILSMSHLNKKIDKRYRREDKIALYINEIQNDLLQISKIMQVDKTVFDNLLLLYPFFEANTMYCPGTLMEIESHHLFLAEHSFLQFLSESMVRINEKVLYFFLSSNSIEKSARVRTVDNWSRFLFYGSPFWPKELVACFNNDEEKKSVPYFSITSYFLFACVVIQKKKFPLACLLFKNLSQYTSKCTHRDWESLKESLKKILKAQKELSNISKPSSGVYSMDSEFIKLFEDTLNPSELTLMEEDANIRKYLTTLLKFLAMEYLLLELSNYISGIENKMTDDLFTYFYQGLLSFLCYCSHDAQVELNQFLPSALPPEKEFESHLERSEKEMWDFLKETGQIGAYLHHLQFLRESSELEKAKEEEFVVV